MAETARENLLMILRTERETIRELARTLTGIEMALGCCEPNAEMLETDPTGALDIAGANNRAIGTVLYRIGRIRDAIGDHAPPSPGGNVFEKALGLAAQQSQQAYVNQNQLRSR